MKITKFVHSCVLVEDDDKAVLFDPGIFSWNSGVVDIDELPTLESLVITHMHPDHMGEPFVKGLLRKQPDLLCIAPDDAHDQLKQWGAKRVQSSGTELCKIEVSEHAPVEPFGVQVKNLQAHWGDLVTHPGDTHELSNTCQVLLLPVQAPWGTTIRAIELADKLRPKYVVPIHDWMWNDQWRQMCYDRFEQIFHDMGIGFLRPTDGEPIEL